MTVARRYDDDVAQMLFRLLPWALTANAAITLLVVAALWPTGQDGRLATWAIAQLLAILLRVMLLVSFRRQPGPPPGPPIGRWLSLFVAGVALSGMLWGAAAALFLEVSRPLHTVLISFALGGIAAGAVTTLSYHACSFLIFLLACLGPLTVRLALAGDELHLAMAAMIAVFAALLFLIARSFRRTWVGTLRLAGEKQHLLDTLEQQVLDRTAALQDTNARLHRAMAERLRAQREAQQARTEAERANLAKTKFLAAASHDLRQPAHSLTLLAAALSAQLRNHPTCKLATHLEATTRALSELLNSLLDISRLDAGGIVPEVVPVPLGPLIERLAGEYVLRAREQGLSFRHVPSSAWCRTDPALLDRILRNLIENALRYTKQGRILIGCRRRAGMIAVQVIDTGIGIPQDRLGEIFDEFYQVARPDRGDGRQGVGLGLAIVARLSGILDHPVTVQSRLGRGSCFSVTVPLAGSAERRAEAAAG